MNIFDQETVAPERADLASATTSELPGGGLPARDPWAVPRDPAQGEQSTGDARSTDPADGGTGPMTERQRLLHLVAQHILEHGVSGLTLRNLGRAIGTNNRMLLYYFDSKENMVAAALTEAGAWEPRFYGTLVDLVDSDAPLADRLVASWAGISHPANRPYIRLFFEILGLALHEKGRYDEFLQGVGSLWLSQIATEVRAEGVPDPLATELAQEMLAVWRGLQFILVHDEDPEVIERINRRSVEGFCARVAAAAGASPQGGTGTAVPTAEAGC
ncbi:TetR/AcrR family transcriptional regulator [Nakamurella silvestris]|nr:TetR/AcrR family transcriptional regulator [Nakamurella silvestris]